MGWWFIGKRFGNKKIVIREPSKDNPYAILITKRGGIQNRLILSYKKEDLIYYGYSIAEIKNGVVKLILFGGKIMPMPTHIVAVGGIVENVQGDILLVKTYHGGWVFPGGQVEAGENLTDALIREINEESGIDVVVSYLIGVYSNTSMYKWHDGVTDIPTKVMLDFTCVPVGGELCTSEETSDCGWFKREKVLDIITAPATRARYQAYLDFKGKPCYMEYVTRPDFEIKLERTV
jgi:8-oxo-dGTP diphosphatase